MTVMSDMTLDELTDLMNRFVADMGWYEAESPFRQSPRNIAVSLTLEASEVLEHFQWGDGAEPEQILADSGMDIITADDLNDGAEKAVAAAA